MLNIKNISIGFLGKNGKSTSCINTGVALSKLGKKVLLVDCDKDAFFDIPLSNYKDYFLKGNFINNRSSFIVTRPEYELDIFTSTSSYSDLLKIKNDYISFIQEQKKLYDFILFNFPGGRDSLDLFDVHSSIIDRPVFVTTQDTNAFNVVKKMIYDVYQIMHKADLHIHYPLVFNLLLSKLVPEKAKEQFDGDAGRRYVNTWLFNQYDKFLENEFRNLEDKMDFAHINHGFIFKRKPLENPKLIIEPLFHIAQSDDIVMAERYLKSFYTLDKLEIKDPNTSLSIEAVKRNARIFSESEN